MGKYKVLSHTLKAVAIHMCLYMLSGKNFGGILVGNTRCFGGISQLPKNRPQRVLLLLASMSARAIFLVLVLFSTLAIGQAPFDGQQKRVPLTCQSELKAIPC